MTKLKKSLIINGAILRVALILFFSLVISGCNFNNLPAEREGVLIYATDIGENFKPGTILAPINRSQKILLGEVTTFNGHEVYEAKSFYSDELKFIKDKKPDMYIGLFWVLTDKGNLPYVYVHLIDPKSKGEDKPNDFYSFAGIQEGHIMVVELSWLSAAEYMGKKAYMDLYDEVSLTPEEEEEVKRYSEKGKKDSWAIGSYRGVFRERHVNRLMDKQLYALNEQELTTALSILTSNLLSENGLINRIDSNDGELQALTIIQPK